MGIVRTKSFGLAVYEQGDKNSKKLALLLPGRLDTKDYPHMRSHVDYLAGRGYFAVSFDPPGTWESEGDISIYSMTSYAKAIDELIEHYGNRPTFLVGHSRGGSMAMIAGTRNNRVVGFASIMSYYSFDPKLAGMYPDPEWEKRGYLLERRDVPGEDKYIEYKLPYEFLQDQIKYDMSRDLRRSTKPKLFVYGVQDTTVPPEGVKEAYEIAESPKEIASIKSDHDYRRHPQLVQEVNAIVGKFLVKYDKWG